jgi:hypothetical protein
MIIFLLEEVAASAARAKTQTQRRFAERIPHQHFGTAQGDPVATGEY